MTLVQPGRAQSAWTSGSSCWTHQPYQPNGTAGICATAWLKMGATVTRLHRAWRLARPQVTGACVTSHGFIAPHGHEQLAVGTPALQLEPERASIHIMPPAKTLSPTMSSLATKFSRSGRRSVPKVRFEKQAGNAAWVGSTRLMKTKNTALLAGC